MHDLKTFVFFTLALLLPLSTASAQDARAMVQQAVDTEIAANRADHSHWLFHETYKSPQKNIRQWVVQTKDGEVKRIYSRNGQPVPEIEQRAAITQFLNDSAARAKQHKDDNKDDKQAEAFMRQFPDGFLWTIVEKNDFATRLHYKPNPDYDPPTREARVLAAMEGDMVVHTTQHRIISLDGHLTDDVTFGFGLFGRLYKGGSFSIERKELAPGIWQIVSNHTHINGHALIFKTISEQEDDQKTDFTRLPDDLTLQQAADKAMEQAVK